MMFLPFLQSLFLSAQLMVLPFGIVGQGVSADAIGSSWSLVTAPVITYERIYQAGNTVVAITSSTTYARSVDHGVTWSTLTAPICSGSSVCTFDAIAGDGAGDWVIGTNPAGQGGVWYSTDDALTWTHSTGLSPPSNAQFYKATYGAGVFVMIDGNRSVVGHHNYYSIDGGANWLVTIGESAADSYGITFDGSTFILGQDGAVATSTNGITFTARTESIYDLWIGNASNSGHAVFAGLTGHSMYSSNHGTSWTTGGTGLTANTMRGCAYATSGDAYCVSSDGTNRASKTTDNGANFTMMAAPGTHTWYDIAPCGIHMCAVSNDGYIMRL